MPTLTESYVDLFGPVSGRVEVTAGSERESAAGGSRVVSRTERIKFTGGVFALAGIEPGLVEVYVWIDDGPTFGRRVTIPEGDGEHRLSDLAPEALLPNTSPYLTLAEVRELLAELAAPTALVPTPVRTASTTALSGQLVRVNATAGPVTITLPGVQTGLLVGVVKIDGSANAVTVIPLGDDDLDVSVSLTTAGASVQLIGGGTAWTPLLGGTSGGTPNPNPDPPPTTAGYSAGYSAPYA